MAAKKRSRWCGVSIFFQGFSRENENRSSPKMWQFEKILPWTQGSQKKLWEFFCHSSKWRTSGAEVSHKFLICHLYFGVLSSLIAPDTTWYHMLDTPTTSISPHPTPGQLWREKNTTPMRTDLQAISTEPLERTQNNEACFLFFFGLVGSFPH